MLNLVAYITTPEIPDCVLAYFFHRYLEKNCFPVLDDLRFFHCRDNQRVVTFCSNILQLDNIRASVASSPTTDHASAEYAQRVEKITKKKKNSRRCRKKTQKHVPGKLI